MPTTYLSPGVYVEEIDAGPQPIQGVSTSITGAVGVTQYGPTTGKPVLLTSFADYTRQFGGFLTAPPSALYNQWALDPVEGGAWWLFPLAVKGFFDNGGQQLYLKRVFSSTAVAATGSLSEGLSASVVRDAITGAITIQLSHLVNIFNGVKIQLFQGDTGVQIGGDFTVVSYLPATGQVTVNPALPALLSSARNDFAVIHKIAALTNATTTLTFSAQSVGQAAVVSALRFCRPLATRSAFWVTPPSRATIL